MDVQTDLSLPQKHVRILSFLTAHVNPFSPADQNNFANSVDPDETAHNKLSHQDLQCLPFFFDF